MRNYVCGKWGVKVALHIDNAEKWICISLKWIEIMYNAEMNLSATES